MKNKKAILWWNGLDIGQKIRYTKKHKNNFTASAVSQNNEVIAEIYNLVNQEQTAKQ